MMCNRSKQNKATDTSNKPVKVGEEWEIVEVKQSHPDWKVVLVIAVSILLFSSWAHAAITGDTYLFDEILNVIVTVAKALS